MKLYQFAGWMAMVALGLWVFARPVKSVPVAEPEPVPMPEPGPNPMADPDPFWGWWGYKNLEWNKGANVAKINTIPPWWWWKWAKYNN